MNDLPKPNDKIPRLDGRAFTDVFTSALLDDNLGAGVQISGTTGSGKSNLAEWMFVQLLEQDVPCLLFDPHGNTAKKVLRMCQDLPQRVRDKLLYVRPADPNITAGINPLFVDPQIASDYERNSQICVRVEQTAQIVFSTFGETKFGSRPVLRKWLTRWLGVLARSGLTLTDALLLIDPKHPVYELLLELVPDEMVRYQLEALMTLKLPELEAEIGSARNRIIATLEHPVCQTIFSRRDDTLDMRWVYDNDMSLIVDLDKAGLLSEDAQQLICNLYLNQYLATVLSTSEANRRQRFCFIDELPVFESSSPLLMDMCTEIRKFRTKFVFLHQGSARFPGRHANEFLNTITDMCRVHVFMRHGASDAQFFGEQVTLSTWDSKQVKHVQRTPQQFTEGHELVELVDRSEGTSEAEAVGTSEGTSDELTDTLTQAVAKARTKADEHGGSRSTTEANSSAKSKGRSQNRSDTATSTKSRTLSRTVKQTLVPRIVTKDIVTAVQFYTPEEIDRDTASEIKSFNTGEGFLQIDGIATYRVMAPLAVDLLSETPRFAAEKTQQFLDQQYKLPEFASPAEIQQERRAFLQRLVGELKGMLQDQKRGRQGLLEGGLGEHAVEQPDAKREAPKPEEYEGDF